MEWSLKLDLGSIDSCKYGSVQNTKIDLPLLANSTYDLPPIFKDRARVDRISSELVDKFGHLFGKDQEAKTRARATFACLVAAYQNPLVDYEQTPGLRSAAELNLTGFALDDVVDTTIKIQNGVANYKVFLAFLNVFGHEEMDLNKFMPGVVGSSEESGEGSIMGFARLMIAYNSAIVDFLKYAWDPAAIKHFKKESLAGAEANYFTLAGKFSPAASLSYASYNRLLGQCLHGLRLFAEENAMLTPGAQMPDEVRNSLLFSMMMDSFGNGCSLLNAIIGLRKDIEEDAWGDTPILRNVVERGMTLQQAFDDAVHGFKAEVRDLNITLDILSETYGDAEGVDEFLRVVEHTFMGTCLFYADESARSRYPGTSVEATKSLVFKHGKVNSTGTTT